MQSRIIIGTLAMAAGLSGAVMSTGVVVTAGMAEIVAGEYQKINQRQLQQFVKDLG